MERNDNSFVSEREQNVVLSPSDDRLLDEFFSMESPSVSDDDRFIQRVMSAIPVKVGWERRLNMIWATLCLVVAIGVIHSKGLLGAFAIDLSVFANNFLVDYSPCELLFVLLLFPLLLVSMTYQLLKSEI